MSRRNADEESASTHAEITSSTELDYLSLMHKRVPESTRERYRGREYAIQPHTDAGGDAYYIGDVYSGIKFALDWAIPDAGPYLQHVKRVAKNFPSLAWLDHWMEVTTSPIKWKFIKHHPANRQERSSRTKVCLIDYNKDQQVKTRYCTEISELKDIIGEQMEDHQTRMIVVEDLSRDVIEVIGSLYNVPPEFFRGHLDDYLFHNTRDPWAQHPRLTDLTESYVNLLYLRARYYTNEEDFEEAEFETGTWNVTRRLDSDRSRKRLMYGLLDAPGSSIALLRAKISLYVGGEGGDGANTIGIVLVDPTPSVGRTLWGDTEHFGSSPSMNSPCEALEDPLGSSFFDQAIRFQSRLSTDDLETARVFPLLLALPSIRIVVSEWLLITKYMTMTIGKMEWEFEKPFFGEKSSDADSLLSKQSPWFRNIPIYRTSMRHSAEAIFERTTDAGWELASSPSCPATVRALHKDLLKAERQMEELQGRLERLRELCFTFGGSRRAEREARQNQNSTILTLLATIFLPLNFATSFLSMSDNFSFKSNTFWLFWAIGVGLLALVLGWVQRRHLEARFWSIFYDDAS